MTVRTSERQLEVFRAVMATGSISAAAKQLNVSQPGVSGIIRRMEDVLGVALFDRAGGRLVPTVEAQRIFAEVQRVYGQFDRLVMSIRAIASGKNALFRLGLSPSMARRIGPMALARMAAKVEGLRIYCDTLTREQIADYLIFGRGECVTALLTTGDDAIESVIVGHGRLVCIVPQGHALARRRLIRVEDLRQAPFISFESGGPHGRYIATLFAAAGLEPDVAIYVNSSDMAVTFVQEKAGIAIIDDFALPPGDRTSFAVVPLAGSPRIPVYVHWCKYRPRSQFVDGYIAEMRRTLASKRV